MYKLATKRKMKDLDQTTIFHYLGDLFDLTNIVVENYKTSISITRIFDSFNLHTLFMLVRANSLHGQTYTCLAGQQNLATIYVNRIFTVSCFD